MTNPDCHYGDHLWMGGGSCVRCGIQLRCYCGCFIREDDIERHLRDSCRLAEAFRNQERQSIESTFAP
jgi:hypothetical protein